VLGSAKREPRKLFSKYSKLCDHDDFNVTDRRTTCRSNPALCVASRGKSETENLFVRLLTAMRCPDPGTPIHGSRDCSSAIHAHGSSCTFGCYHGYQLIGSSRIICYTNVTGLTQWSNDTPACQRQSTSVSFIVVRPCSPLTPTGAIWVEP